MAAALIIIMLKAVLPPRRPGLRRRRSRVAVVGIAASGLLPLAAVAQHPRRRPVPHAVARWWPSTGSRCSSAPSCSSAALLDLLLSSEYLERHGIASRPEYLALLLFSAAGMLVMTTANDLIVVFVALEALSIPLYVLAAYDRNRRRSLEAGMKYFVLGAFSSAVFLYGIALGLRRDRHHLALRDRRRSSRTSPWSTAARCSPA